MIRVRIAGTDDHQRLIGFIRDHWSSTHIFTQRPELFTWQHLQHDDRLNMVLAEEVDGDGELGRVLGVLGFIPLGRFAPDLGDRDLFLAIWKVREDGAPPGVGLRLLKFLTSELKPRMIAAIGISEMVRPIYKVLKYEVGSLCHAAIFNPSRADSLRVASGVPPHAFRADPAAGGEHVTLTPLTRAADAATRKAVDAVAGGRLPEKNWQYIETRFLTHPWYQYDVHLVRRDGDPAAVVVWRSVEAEDAAVLRIVDIIGATTWLAEAGTVLREAVVQADAEYIDLMQWGVDRTLLDAAGFVMTTDHPGMVVPNYFSPFEARNIEVELAVRVFEDDAPDVVLYRADSDQDRPNRVSDLADHR